jgi:putative methyltransferase
MEPAMKLPRFFSSGPDKGKPAGKTILISEPHAIENPAPFLPYVWAILKSYWERHGEGDYYHWLDPVFRNDDAATLLQPYDGVPIDVLGLSCYTWNWKLQCRIAQEAKARNPQCLVIAGGPEPDYKDPLFFRKHPEIDIVAVKDGEITLNKILSKLMRDDRRFDDIGGLYLPGADGALPVSTGPAEVPTSFDHSPYVEQSAYYERTIAARRPGVFHATWETNRGCPYSCSFCDWGSNTMSKVRRFDMERIEADLDWLGRMGVAMVFSADANFGILERDLEIADLMNAVKRKYGHPTYLYYSAAKNHPERAIAIAKKFAETGVCPTHTLAIQHTDEEVLAATDRANISAAKQVTAAKALLESRIPIDVQLIVGIPGDTVKKWKACLADLMEWGIHEEYYTFFYHVLPNAPAADRSFMERWEVETVDRLTLSDPRRPRTKQELDLIRMTRSRLIVRSKTFSRPDWVAMTTYGTLIKALHNASLTRLISIYLRLSHGVAYSTFYERLIEDFFARRAPSEAWYRELSNHYRSFLEDDDATDHMEVKELPRLSFLLDPSRWIYVQICLRFDEFFDELKSYLLRQYPGVANLESVIDFQKQVVILPTYDRSVGKTFPAEVDWIRYFEDARGRTGSETLGEPETVSNSVVEVTDQTSGGQTYFLHPLDWGSGDWQDRRIEWVKHTVVQRNSAVKNNFQQLRLRAPGLLASRGG